MSSSATTSSIDNSLATALAEMTGYAFLTHRRDRDSGNQIGNTRREAFVEMCLHYLLQTPEGGRVLWAAINPQRANTFRSSTHSRQFVTDGGRPDFKITIDHTDGSPESHILLELKVGDSISPEQSNGYLLELKTLKDDMKAAYLVVLAPEWNPAVFKAPSVELQQDVRRLSFRDLTQAAEDLQLAPHDLALWRFLEVTAEGMQTPIPPLGDALVLNSRHVVNELNGWVELFKSLHPYLPHGSWTTGFINLPKYNLLDTEYSFQHQRNDPKSQGTGWCIDFGESAAYEDDTRAQKSPIWFHFRGPRGGRSQWQSARLGLGSSPSEAMERFKAHDDGTAPQMPSSFEGQGATEQFEVARKILWTAMQAASVAAWQSGLKTRKPESDATSFGLLMSGPSKRQVRVSIAPITGEGLRIQIEGVPVPLSASDTSGRCYVNDVVTAMKKSIHQVNEVSA